MFQLRSQFSHDSPTSLAADFPILTKLRSMLVGITLAVFQKLAGNGKERAELTCLAVIPQPSHRVRVKSHILNLHMDTGAAGSGA